MSPGVLLSTPGSLVEGDLLSLYGSTPDTASQTSPDASSEANDDVDTDRDEDDGSGRGKIFEVNDPPGPRKMSEKKRADNAKFDIWLEENQQNLSKGAGKLVLDEERSANWLMREFENKKIITSPRDYQLELFERAKTQNTIAVLDTGSGKTLIAALLLRWTIQNELENRSQGQPKRIAFFLVDKVALVFQQHAVLTCNLDYSVAKFCGQMLDRSSAEFWETTFQENMAIVCTSEILYQCLHHSYIRMDQINLLIFDECHHTKKNHPYARIIKDFYIQNEDNEARPRILGMTASPVDAQIDPRIAAAELEGLLHSQIATVSDPTIIQHTISCPKEEIVLEYDRRPRQWTTPLHQSIKALVGNHDHFTKAFVFTSQATAELGPWCADRYWQLFFNQDDIAKLETQAERSLLRQGAFSQLMGLDKNRVREAHELVKNHEFEQPILDTRLFSSKVIELWKTLHDQFSSQDLIRRCIVFVKQRNTANILVDLLKQPELKIPGLEPGILIGGGRNDSSWESSKTSYRDQVLTIIKFKKGELNCIFATSVAEEGLDIPDCNIIIRFDLYDTLIQYIQSRGRARQEKSTYIHMIERGNSEQLQKMKQLKQSEDGLRKFCEAMPDTRKLTGNNFKMDYFLRKEKGQRQYTVPETGAKLNYKQSLICLANFVSSLPHPPETNLAPEYMVNTTEGGFQCEVILPAASPIRSAIGKVHGSKAVAKCSAAFEMCLQLVRGNYLDAHLRPTLTKQLPAMRNARLAISSKKKEEYGMRMKPEVWSTLGEPTELFVTALTLESPDSLGRPSLPLLLLTRRRIPQVASFPIYFGKSRSSIVNFVLAGEPIEVDEAELTSLTAFTLSIFKDVFSKEYEATFLDLPYFLAPTCKDHSFDFSAPASDELIDWDTVKYVQENNIVTYNFDEPDDFFEHKYVWDPWDGARKFYLRGRRHDMKPTDPVPEGIVAPGHRAWRTTCDAHDILNYSNSLWSKSRAKFKSRGDQAVVEAELLSTQRNLLDDSLEGEDLEPKQCFLVLEPLKISPLPVQVVAMAYNFPAIIHRVDSNLVALDACNMLGLNIRPDLALEAFTKDSDNTDEQDVEQVNFQRGMGNNYERLEFLGDAFLKMATTIAIYTLIPDKDEFEYHVERMILICNRNLFNNALEVKLEEYIRSMAFNRRTWYPEGLTLKRGKRKDIRKKHVLADKSIADVCEAIIGAAYLTAQEAGNFDMAIQAVTRMVNDKNHTMQTWSDYYAVYKKPAWQTMPTNSVQEDMAEKFHKRMGYRFQYPRLLRSAFQHPTYPTSWERLPSYQRLEFLGDALLDMACIDHLFHRFPGTDPQWLTEHKMAMVSNQFLGCLAVYIGFHRSLQHSSPAVQSEIASYVTEIEEALAAAKVAAVQEDKSESEFARDFWVDCSRPPKCLPDTIEAYVGAIFVDSSYDYQTVQDFFDKHIQFWFEDMRLYDTFANKHPVTFLGHEMQHRFRCQEWRLLTREIMVDNDEEGGMMGEKQVVCAVMVHGQKLAHAVAQSARCSKIGAAKKALRELEGWEQGEFRRRVGCDCKVVGEVEGKDGEKGEEVEIEVYGDTI
ncbi:Dicer-like protein 1 [Podospora pseudoanserina]|uniref:Dicer-like protein 1 n=1 Tax=Podospora pseudoanserina TaxID=2609844 RepID=A0ABR0HT14_9PEZI|nr:Dicer-like protein 1 [Podospora pseudoanserina]